MIRREQRAREHVAEQEHDPDDLVGLDAPRNDAFREVPRVGLQGLVRPRLEGLDVVVVHRSRLGEDLLFRHRRQQLGLGDEPGPLFAQLGALVPEVRHQLSQARGGAFQTGFGCGGQFPAVTHLGHLLASST